MSRAATRTTATPGGSVLAVADQLRGDRRFTLDPAGRITGVRRGRAWAERYDYDPLGNLASVSARAAAGVPSLAGHAAGPRTYSGTLIRRAGGLSYTHDGQGRITARRARTLSGRTRIWSYIWDADDHLIQVVTPDGHHWRYRYDPLGRRIAKQHYAPDGTTLIETTRFSWDGPVLAEQATTRAADTADAAGAAGAAGCSPSLRMSMMATL